MRTQFFSFLISLSLSVPAASAVGINMQGGLLGWVPRPPLPCHGESCYIPCQQAFDTAGNVSAVSNACLQHCMLNNGGGGYPATFMDACTSCASTDIRAAVRLGVYANCQVATVIGGGIIDELVEATGCGEEPETCDTSAANAGNLQSGGSLQIMQTVVGAMNKSLGAGTVKLLKTKKEEAAFRAKIKAQTGPDGKRKKR